MAVAPQQRPSVNMGHGQMAENWRQSSKHTEHMHRGERAKTQGEGRKQRTGACRGRRGVPGAGGDCSEGVNDAAEDLLEVPTGAFPRKKSEQRVLLRPKRGST